MNNLIFNDEQIKRFWSNVDIKGEDECWNWKLSKGINHGYGKVSILRYNFLAHRLSYFLTYGDIPKDDSSKGTLFVCHKCDNKICCNPKHLFLGNTQDNMNDMKLKNRSSSKYGEDNLKHKLTEQQVFDIRQKYSNGLSQKDLSIEYEVQISTISRIVNYKRWTHI